MTTPSKEPKAPWYKEFVYEVQKSFNKQDLYRDTPIRYLGYANEVGEAFRAWVPVNLVRSTYLISSAYALADGLDKSHKAYNKNWTDKAERRKQVGITFLDTLTWQGFASVIVPGYTINRICATSLGIFKRSTMIPIPIAKGISTIIALCSIPFIIKPIDSLVDVGMNWTIRKNLYTINYPKD